MRPPALERRQTQVPVEMTADEGSWDDEAHSELSEPDKRSGEWPERAPSAISAQRLGTTGDPAGVRAPSSIHHGARPLIICSARGRCRGPGAGIRIWNQTEVASDDDGTSAGGCSIAEMIILGGGCSKDQPV